MKNADDSKCKQLSESSEELVHSLIQTQTVSLRLEQSVKGAWEDMNIDVVGTHS